MKRCEEWTPENILRIHEALAMLLYDRFGGEDGDDAPLRRWLRMFPAIEASVDPAWSLCTTGQVLATLHHVGLWIEHLVKDGPDGRRKRLTLNGVTLEYHGERGE